MSCLDNGIVICASESGSVAYDESRVMKKGRVGPGQIFCVDTTRGAVMDDEEITQKFAARRPYHKWLQENLVSLDEIVARIDSSAWPEPTAPRLRTAAPTVTPR